MQELVPCPFWLINLRMVLMAQRGSIRLHFGDDADPTTQEIALE